MRANIVRIIGSGAVRFAALAALVALGVVFVPDGFMDRIERGVGTVGGYLQGESAKRAPALARDISQQTQETKGDLDNLYRSFKEKYLPAVNGWVYGLFGSGGKSK
ncbi:MAG: hypothetical protein WCX69_00425 [Candidatus Paceibacterota bacterium]